MKTKRYTYSPKQGCVSIIPRGTDGELDPPKYKIVLVNMTYSF